MNRDKQTVDARGLPCPQPVVQTKRALAQGGFDLLEVLVDNKAAVANVSRYAAHAGFSVEETHEGPDGISIIISMSGAAEEVGGEREEAAFADAVSSCPVSGGGKTLMIMKDTIGEGSPELGRLLMSGFIFALTEQDRPPRRLVLMNGGVKLAVRGAKELEDLGKLEKGGLEIVVCGTCLDFFGLKEQLGAGTVSNMYDIARIMLEEETLVLS